MKNIVPDYLKWLKDNIQIKKHDESIMQIATPFLNRHNDYIEIYAEKSGENEIKLSDKGETISDLELYGIDLFTSKRQNILKTILNGHGISLNGKEIYVKSTASTIASKKHSLIQALIQVDNLFTLHNI